MKAAVKPMCGVREIKFYEQIKQNLTDPHWEMLRKLVPEYRGTVKMPFRGKVVSLNLKIIILIYLARIQQIYR